jgi:DNA invertase Pin-like site-specific DNA recombinase
MKRVAIYLRVSTDKQTTDNQRREIEATPSSTASPSTAKDVCRMRKTSSDVRVGI